MNPRHVDTVPGIRAQMQREAAIAMLAEILDVAGVSALIGAQPVTVRSYHSRAQAARRGGPSNPGSGSTMPAPIGYKSDSPLWWKADIEAWHAGRPGPGSPGQPRPGRRKPATP